MLKIFNKKEKGFTLLEVLLVIALIAILAGIILVAIKPAARIQEANDTQRQSDVTSILNAVYQYAIDNNGTLPDDDSGSPDLSATENHIGSGATSCDTNCSPVSGGGDCIDLSNDLVDNGYLASMPVNPGTSSVSFDTDHSGYYIVQASNGTLTVGSCVDDIDGNPITISR